MNTIPSIVVAIYIIWAVVGGKNTLRAFLSVILFCLLWFFQLCLDWTSPVPEEKFYSVRDGRILETFLLAVAPFAFRAVFRRGARLRVWWDNLPSWVGWALLCSFPVCAKPALEWYNGQVSDYETPAMLLGAIWATVLVIHEFRKIRDAIAYSRRRDESFNE